MTHFKFNFKDYLSGPYKTQTAQRRRSTSKSAENYRKLGSNSGIGLGLGLVFRVSDTQWHYGVN